jgi:hypothetical protein
MLFRGSCPYFPDGIVVERSPCLVSRRYVGASLLIAQSSSFLNRDVCAFALRCGEEALRVSQSIKHLITCAFLRKGTC